MALVRTNLGTFFTTTGVTTFTTTSFTPPNNSFLVAFWCMQAANNTTDSCTLTGGGLTWNKRLDVVNSGPFERSSCFTAPVTTGASMTLTVGTDTTSFEGCVAAYAYTGYNVSSPVGATASAECDGAGAQTITLSASPALSSEVLACLSGDTNTGALGATHGTGWTEVDHFTDGANVEMETEARSNSTSTSVTWATGLGNSVGYGFALEIKAFAVPAAGGNLPLMGIGYRKHFMMPKKCLVAPRKRELICF